MHREHKIVDATERLTAKQR